MDNPALVSPSAEDIANQIAAERDVDVIFHSGRLDREVAHRITQDVRKRNKRRNVLFILVTFGGDGGAAYRIARLLQANYEEFTLYATGYCKSAGTLLATGAHRLVMSDHAELGPLDMQMSKRDELWELESSLTIMDTLTTLQQKALSACEAFFITLSVKSNGTITLRTATDIATAMTTGLFTPIYNQISPMALGEAGRAMRVAESYGELLMEAGGNVLPNALHRLLEGYPAHDFVIDRFESQRLFYDVREPDELESQLAECLGDRAIFPNMDPDIPSRLIFGFLSDEISDESTKNVEQYGGKYVDEPRSNEAKSEAGKALGSEGPYLGEDGGGEELISLGADEQEAGYSND